MAENKYLAYLIAANAKRQSVLEEAHRQLGRDLQGFGRELEAQPGFVGMLPNPNFPTCPADVTEQLSQPKPDPLGADDGKPIRPGHPGDTARKQVVVWSVQQDAFREIARLYASIKGGSIVGPTVA